MASKIYEAISKVMEDVGVVGKNGVNTFDNYKFRGIDDVMNALNPAMVKNHVFVAPQILDCKREERQSKSGGLMMYTVLTVKYTFYTDDGSSVVAVVIGEAADRSDKSANKAMSAAFKYACFQTFCIPTEEMQDADGESPEIGNKKQSREEIVDDANKRTEDTAERNAMIDQLLALLNEANKSLRWVLGGFEKGGRKCNSLHDLTDKEIEFAIRNLEKMLNSAA